MPDLSTTEGQKSAKIDIELSKQSYCDDATSTGPSGLIIFKHHKNKKNKNKNIIFDRKLVSKSYDSGLNQVRLLN